MKKQEFSEEEKLLVQEFKDSFPSLSGLVLEGTDGESSVFGNAVNEISRWWIDKLK